jgi:uridine kinase
MNDASVIAIIGGSGSGKTWLSRRLAAAFPNEATCVSLDDFYFDRSHLSAQERRIVNYDDPQAIEWETLQKFVRAFRAGQQTGIPRYDFSTHCRDPQAIECRPTRLLIMEGLWLLTQPGVRELFDLSIYLECPAQTRLERRLARDVAERGRDADEVRRVFSTVVGPMHIEHVAPQRRFANVVLHDPVSEADLEAVTARVHGTMANHWRSAA